MSGVQALTLSHAPERFALRSERLGPLPLINHFIARIGLPDLLARHVPSDARCSIPHAQAPRVRHQIPEITDFLATVPMESTT